MGKRRLDLLLVDRGLAESREKAQALVMAGQVSIGDQRATKPGVLINDAAGLKVVIGPTFVGRGGDKLEGALSRFGMSVEGINALDVGASTGGFTDCLLQRGAARVYAIDVGRNQIDYRLRTDPRVVVMEGINARKGVDLPEEVDLATIDVSFISLKLVLPSAFYCLNRGGEVVALFKPQFEAERGEVPRGGVIRDRQLHSRLIGRFVAWCAEHCVRILDFTTSPIEGSEGNIEFFLRLKPLNPSEGEGAP